MGDQILGLRLFYNFAKEILGSIIVAQWKERAWFYPRLNDDYRLRSNVFLQMDGELSYCERFRRKFYDVGALYGRPLLKSFAIKA